MTTKTSTRVYLWPQNSDVRIFEDPASEASISVHEYYNKTDEPAYKSFNIQDVWVPLYSRNTGAGSALLSFVLGYYDTSKENLRLAVSGCCGPSRISTEDEIARMHTGRGHLENCQSVKDRLSHHELIRWYGKFGFVDHPDSGDEHCCSWYLFRPQGG
jgi:hypothetical protein